MVYLLHRATTYQSTLEWLEEAKANIDEDAFIFLVGNRCDLEDEREVAKTDAMKQVLKSDFDQYFETSAKTGENVEELF